MTPWARDALGAEKARIDARARSLGVTVGAMQNGRRDKWIVSVREYGASENAVYLRATGDLAAILDGVLDDYEIAKVPA